MSDKFDNIEELFRDNLNGMESEVDPGMWEQISGQISNAGGSSGSGSESVSGSGSGVSAGGSVGMGAAAKVAIVAGTAGLISIGSYFYINNDESSEQEVAQQEMVVDQTVEESPIIEEDRVENTPASSDNSNSEVVVDQNEDDNVVMNDFVEETTTENSVAVEEHPAQSPVNEVKEQVASGDAVERKSDPEVQEKPIANEPEEIEHFEPSIYASVKEGQIPLEVDFENRGTQVDEVEWKIGSGDYERGDAYLNHVFENSGDYWVVLRIKGSDGKYYKDSALISVEGNAMLNIPNTFSPNGDGINDDFTIEHENIQSIRCQILDRNMNPILEFDGMQSSWDGRNKAGQRVEKGTYYYIVEAIDNEGKPRREKGSLTVW